MGSSKYVKRAKSALKADPIEPTQKSKVVDERHLEARAAEEQLSKLDARLQAVFDDAEIAKFVSVLCGQLEDEEVPFPSDDAMSIYAHAIPHVLAKSVVQGGIVAEANQPQAVDWFVTSGVVDKVIDGVAREGWLVAPDEDNEACIWSMRLPDVVRAAGAPSKQSSKKPKKRPPKQHHKRK